MCNINSSCYLGIIITITLKSASKFEGEEVAQLHIRDKVASIVRPVKELKGFKKIKLAAGESKEIQFTLTDAELVFYDNAGKFIVEPGEFDIMIGTNSQEGIFGKVIKK